MRSGGRRRAPRESGENPFWITYSDMLSSLAMIFLVLLMAFQALSQMQAEDLKRQKVELENQKKDLQAKVRENKDLADKVQKLAIEKRAEALRKLNSALEKLQKKWPKDVTLDEQTGDMTIKRNIKFANDQAKISDPEDQRFLRQFIPDWANIITQEEYNELIIGLTVEGHADPKGPSANREENYQYNLRLSQERAREVTRFMLQECRGIPRSSREKLRELFSASGRSDVQAFITLREQRHWSDTQIRLAGEAQKYRSVRLRLSLYNPLLQWQQQK